MSTPAFSDRAWSTDRPVPAALWVRVVLGGHGGTPVWRHTGQRRTNTTINKQPVIACDFAFTTHAGQRATTTVRSHAARAVLDEQQEPLLYDPDQPSRAVLLGELPGDPVQTLKDASRGRARSGCWCCCSRWLSSSRTWCWRPSCRGERESCMYLNVVSGCAFF